METYNSNVLRDPRNKRLAKEHELIDEICSRSSKISYEVIKQVRGFPPEGYKIIYDNVKSIIGTHPNGAPIYGTHHEAEIIFPPEYPGAEGAPKCRMLTDVWHPNIRSKDPAKGRICINSKALGAWHTLDMLALRLGQMLQYKNYHAVDEDPWPEDAEVAKWVREYAEPKGIVNKDQGIFVDDTELLQPVKRDQKQRNTGEDDGDWFQKRRRINIEPTIEMEDDLDMSFSKKGQSIATADEPDFDFRVKKR